MAPAGTGSGLKDGNARQEDERQLALMLIRAGGIVDARSLAAPLAKSRAFRLTMLVGEKNVAPDGAAGGAERAGNLSPGKRGSGGGGA